MKGEGFEQRNGFLDESLFSQVNVNKKSRRKILSFFLLHNKRSFRTLFYELKNAKIFPTTLFYYVEAKIKIFTNRILYRYGVFLAE